jgi:energy-converting hydrogenase B subunit Q
VSQRIGIEVGADPGPGVLHQLSGVIAHEQGNILSIEIVEEKSPETVTYFEIDIPGDPQKLVEGLRALPVVHRVALVQTMEKIFGKRIIIVGGGAQVGQVALGAIAEADRHNIRGEHISVDTIPLVGEQPLADAVREVRAQGLLVVSLNMAGSVPDAADLVVTDPVQAGVMTVMAVADTAKFTVERLTRRVF